jgi:chemotaxis protein MotB
MSEDQAATASLTVIKRTKVYKDEGHHGGAWKVAYADFVTAMMAFFLLMWLLNATTEEQRKGIADYFNPTIPISRISGGGSDGLNGSSIFSEETYAKMGTGATRTQSVSGTPDEASVAEQKKSIASDLEKLRQELSENEGKLSEHMAIKLSPEGIILELIDSDDQPLFAVGLSEATPLLEMLLAVVADSFEEFNNEIKIVGHTDNLMFSNSAAYDNWNLSADRANAARRILAANGLDLARIREVSGKADTDPLIPDDPAAAQNRRISIVIITE